MDKKMAFKAGVSAALWMSVLMVLARAARLTSLNSEMILGSLLTQSVSPSSWILGLFLQTAAGGLCGLAYAAGFERLASKNTVKDGFIFAYLHLLISGILLMGLLPYIHPFLNGSAPAGLIKVPGVFAANYGWFTSALLVLTHILFGTIVGRMYKLSQRRTLQSIHDFEVPFRAPGQKAA